MSYSVDDSPSVAEVDDLFNNDEDTYALAPTDFPESKQQQLIEIYNSNFKLFQASIAKILRDNQDIFPLNTNNIDETFTEESFVFTFNGPLNPQLLSLIYKSIDISNKGKITTAAIMRFLKTQKKRQSTIINSDWVFQTIKAMDISTKNSDNVEFLQFNEHFAEIGIHESIAENIFQQVDTDVDGRISGEEFLQWRAKFTFDNFRKMSHKLNKTLVFLEDVIAELSDVDDDDDSFEHIDSHVNTDDEYENIDDEESVISNNNMHTLLTEILDSLSLDVEETNTNKLKDVIQLAIVRLKYQLADAKQNEITRERQHSQVVYDSLVYKSELIKSKVHTEKIAKQLSEMIGREVKTDDPKELHHFIAELQHEMADLRMDKIQSDKRLEKWMLEAKKLQYKLAEERMAIMHFKKGVSEAIGKQVNCEQIDVLLKRLQYHVADDRMTIIRSHRKSATLELMSQQMQYQLADFKLANIKLRGEFNRLITADISDITDVGELRKIISSLQLKLKNAGLDSNELKNFFMQCKENDEKIQFEYADEAIKDIDMEKQLESIEDSDEENMQHFEQVSDVRTLRTLIRVLQKDLKDSRMNHLAMSQSRSHLECQRHDLRSKLKSEEKKFTVLMRKSQQFTVLDVKDILPTVNENKHDIVLPVSAADFTDELCDGSQEMMDDMSLVLQVQALQMQLANAKALAMHSRKESTVLTDLVQQLQCKLDDGSSSDDDNIGYREYDESRRSSAADLQTKKLREKVEKYKTQYEEELRRMHAFKEDKMRMDLKYAITKETADQFKDEAALLRKQLQEMEEEREKVIDDKLRLAYLEAEQQRMEVKYDTTKSIADGMRDEASELKEKVLNLEREQLERKEQFDDFNQRMNTTARMTNSTVDLKTAFLEAENARMGVKCDTSLESQNRLKEINHRLILKVQSMSNKELRMAFLSAEQQRMAVKYETQKASAHELREEKKRLEQQLYTFKLDREAVENKKLEFAFLKAEKQRMDVKFNHQKESLLEFRQKAKELEDMNALLVEESNKRTQHVKRLSENMTDNHFSDGNPSLSENLSAQWINEVQKLKEENKDLQRRLSNAKTIQVNKLLQYTTPIISIPPPPPMTDLSNVVEEGEMYDEPQLFIAEMPSVPEDNDSGCMEIEELKLKLTAAKLQNISLKRRVSIATEAKIKISLLWIEPKVTIQMVSEFIERLPLKHKEKIWSRHCVHNYIPKDKFLNALHSFLALCIKIKDRAATAPSKLEVQARLQPFVDQMTLRTLQNKGMTLEQFNHHLHAWVLEPVAGLVMATEAQLEWQQEIEELREQVLILEKEKLHMRRASEVELAHVLSQFKDIDEDDDDDDDEQRIQYYKQRVHECEESLISLRNTVSMLEDSVSQCEIKHPHSHLKYRQQQLRDKTRESEDDDDKDNDEVAPQLTTDDEVKNVPFEEFEEERLAFYRNDNGVTKNEHYIGWKNKADKYLAQLEEALQENNGSRDALQEWKQQAQNLQITVERNKEQLNANQEYKKKVESLQQEIEQFKIQHIQQEKIRRQSVAKLHDSLFVKLLDAEADHEDIVAYYEREMEVLKRNLINVEDNKMQNIVHSHNTIHSMRTDIKLLQEDIVSLRTQLKNKRGFFNGWI